MAAMEGAAPGGSRWQQLSLAKMERSGEASPVGGGCVAGDVRWGGVRRMATGHGEGDGGGGARVGKRGE